MADLIHTINGVLFKITDFILGKSPIFIIILGWFLFVTGVIFLVQPEKARQKLLRQGFGMTQFFLLIATFYIAVWALSLGSKIDNALVSLASLAAVVALIWGFFTARARAQALFKDKFALIPVSALKAYAFVQIVVGVVMIVWHKRLW